MRRLFVRLPNHLGDVCMSLPALDHLRAQGFALVVAGRPWARSLLAAYPDEVVALSDRLRAQVQALRHARGGHTLCTLLLTNSLSSALACRLAGLRPIGYATDARRLLLKRALPVPPPLHMVEYYFALAQAVTGVGDASPTPPALRLTPEARARAQRMLRDAGIAGRFVQLCPVAVGLHKGKVKAWPGFGALAARLRSDGHVVVACPGPGEREAVLRAVPTVTVLPETDVGTFAALLAQARLVVANDSGAGHLAAAVGASLVSVFGVTDPQRTRPRGSRVTVVGGPDGWPTVDQVYGTVRRALSEPA